MIPPGINERQWKYYQLGATAHKEGHSKEAAICVHRADDRAWWRAGWIDSDIEARAKHE
jgi:hypothetical protein